MDQLLRSLREIPRRFAAMGAGARFALVAVGMILVVVVAAIAFLGNSGTYQYVFTNLTPEDSTEAAAALKAAGINFRTEAGGSALSVPANDVHEARLLLASAGLPRGGGVGFELFDRGDLGASEFTQRVNLRRATEGELARTIGRLTAVRSARVHLTLPERGLYREDDRKATAAVVVNLQPGRQIQDKELAGIRHLVASAVAGLNPDSVTVMDGRGTVLSGDRSESAKLAQQQREIEDGLEQRIVQLLEPAVGAGAVVAKVTATIDSTEVETTADDYNGDGQVVRSERKTTELVTNEGAQGNGVSGAAANQPLGPSAGPGNGGAGRAQTSRDDETKNYEIPKKVTHTVNRAPRVMRLSAAVLVDGVDGKPRSQEEVARLSDLAKHAVGFDAQRGDRFDISSAPFAKTVDQGSGPTPVWQRPEIVRLTEAGGIAVAAIIGLLLALRAGRRLAGMSSHADVALLKPGSNVAELEAVMNKRELPAAGARSLAADPNAGVRERARELGKTDPARAAHLLRAWISADQEAAANREAEESNV
jgi:flagellar M-ring protein FliF